MEFSYIDYSLDEINFHSFKMSLVNIFLLINLGCEMLYIIDQRLIAQAVSRDKAAQGKFKFL